MFSIHISSIKSHVFIAFISIFFFALHSYIINPPKNKENVIPSVEVKITREEEGEEEGSMTTSSSLFKVLSSYNSNVLLAALLFLLLVVLFVLLLQFYARFFWSNSDQEFFAARRRLRRRRIRRRTVTTTRIIPPVPLGGIDGEASAAAPTSDDKGLDSSVISSIPLFVYEDDEEEEEEEEECVICLGLWEVGDFGRKLRFCGHGFHVECIDMWLSSHSTCPLCRSPVLAVSDQENLKPAINGDVDGIVEAEEEEETEVRLELQLFPTGEDENVVAGDRRLSLSLAVMEENAKTGVDDGVGEGEVRIEVLDEGGGSRGDRRSTSSASSSLMRMLSSRSRSEGDKVFQSAATQDSSS
ncbi:RING-H2 finger protein ATL63-like [Brassica napus]|uniref:RING-H2 finger protein ATL63-like n=1 Tax=Brassica napus TaxID=3708 RepID=UPI0020799065|nr:RING-H2 finger protein ATL63-like [Brassica napus]